MGADAAAFDPILFDLDGTLTDPGPGITRSIGIYECEVLPGIEDVLADLAESGLTLRGVTSKPTVFAREVEEVTPRHRLSGRAARWIGCFGAQPHASKCRFPI